MKMNEPRRPWRTRPAALAAAAAAALGCASPAGAIEIPTGDSDLILRWDNSVRLNAGWRVQGRDPALGNSPVTDEGDYKFGKGDMFNKRFDLLSELELSWRKDFGVRLSGAAWYDDAYSNTHVNQNPLLAASGVPSSYDNNQYSGYVKRYYRSGAEALDAFAFGTFDVGSAPVSVKVGRFSTYWGQALFYQGGIASSQQPIDGGKSAANPGTETRETFLPLTQISVQSQVVPTISVGAQYYLAWDATRAPEGGTYLGSTDFILNGPDRLGVPNPAAPGLEYLPRADALGPAKKSGDWGVFAKFQPEFLGGQSVGVYFRQFDAKAPWLFTTTSGSYRAVYARDTKLYGLSYDGSLGSLAIGAELGLQTNAGLNSAPLAAVDDGAHGNTWHALVNTIALLPQTSLWDTGSLAAELTYDRLQRVTRNAALFNGVGTTTCVNNATGGAGTAADGCATRSAWGVGMALTPQWLQVTPGVDLSAPITLTAGLKGNSAGFLGVNEGNIAYSAGLQANVFNIHSIALIYAASTAPMRTIIEPGLGRVAVGGNGNYGVNDRGRITLTYKVAF